MYDDSTNNGFEGECITETGTTFSLNDDGGCYALGSTFYQVEYTDYTECSSSVPSVIFLDRCDCETAVSGNCDAIYNSSCVLFELPGLRNCGELKNDDLTTALGTTGDAVSLDVLECTTIDIVCENAIVTRGSASSLLRK